MNLSNIIIESQHLLKLCNSWQNKKGYFYSVNKDILHESIGLNISNENSIDDMHKNGWNIISESDGVLKIKNNHLFPNSVQLRKIYEICKKRDINTIIYEALNLGEYIIWNKDDILEESLKSVADYDVRVSAGKRVEETILNALRKRGIKIEDPTSQEDIHDKIDGWWIGKGNKKYPVQVKFRQTGNDVLFEILKDIDRHILGRDMRGSSVLYLVANRHGNTRLFYTDDIKKLAKQIMEIVIKELRTDPDKTNWDGSGWNAKIQHDVDTFRKKLIAYINPLRLNSIAEWDLDI